MTGLAELLNHVALSLSWTIVLAGGIALALALVLVITRYELAVWIGVFTSAIVFVEPPPADALFAADHSDRSIDRRFRLFAAPRVAVALVSTFLVLNVLSASAVIDWGKAGTLSSSSASTSGCSPSGSRDTWTGPSAPGW